MVSVSFFFWQKNIRRVKENRIFFIRIQRTLFFYSGLSKTYLSIIAFSIDDIDRAPRLMDGTSRRTRATETRFFFSFFFLRDPNRFGDRFPARNPFWNSRLDYRYAKITAHRARGRSVEIAGARRTQRTKTTTTSKNKKSARVVSRT